MVTWGSLNFRKTYIVSFCQKMSENCQRTAKIERREKNHKMVPSLVNHPLNLKFLHLKTNLMFSHPLFFENLALPIEAWIRA